MIQLRLDAGAIAALFPEGSEARVKLQHAVIQEFCRHNIKGVVDLNILAPLVKGLEDQMKVHATGVIEKAIGKVKEWPYKVTVNADLMEAAKKEIEKNATDYFAAFAKEMVEKLKLEAFVEKRIQNALHYNIGDEINKKVKEKLAAAAKAME